MDQPSVATWWCGDPLICNYVVDNLGDLVIKGAHLGTRFEPVFGAELSAANRDRNSSTLRLMMVARCSKCVRPALAVRQMSARSASAWPSSAAA